MNEERLLILSAELDELYKTVDTIYQRIEQRRSRFRETEEGIESMAYQLHNLYGAYEELCKIVADYFENEIETTRYHADLLKRMKMDIKGIRPAFISEETYQELDELRRFRHLFRHAYGVTLDPTRVENLLNTALHVRDSFGNDMTRFLAT
jgi:uncharacterized protein YutE (UPF0331/DUF86 family)